MLVGNKCNLTLEKEFQTDDAKAYAETLGIHFFETSAKDSTKVEQAFSTMAAEIKRTHGTTCCVLPPVACSNKREAECCVCVCVCSAHARAIVQVFRASEHDHTVTNSHTLCEYVST